MNNDEKNIEIVSGNGDDLLTAFSEEDSAFLKEFDKAVPPKTK